MATVQALLNLFDSLTGKGSLSLGEKPIALLNAGKTEVWKIITGSTPEENWFGHESQSSDSGADDYFPLLQNGVREYTLPANFHQLRVIEGVTAGFTEVDFVKSNVEKYDFRRARRDAAALSDSAEVLYDIWGTYPGRLVLAQNPATSVEVKLWYVRNATEWVSKSDSADEFPPTMHILIVEWAIARISIGADDARMEKFQAAWQQRVDHQLRAYRRDLAGPNVTVGFME